MQRERWFERRDQGDGAIAKGITGEPINYHRPDAVGHVGIVESIGGERQVGVAELVAIHRCGGIHEGAHGRRPLKRRGEIPHLIGATASGAVSGERVRVVREFIADHGHLCAGDLDLGVQAANGERGEEDG